MNQIEQIVMGQINKIVVAQLHSNGKSESRVANSITRFINYFKSIEPTYPIENLYCAAYLYACKTIPNLFEPEIADIVREIQIANMYNISFPARFVLQLIWLNNLAELEGSNDGYIYAKKILKNIIYVDENPIVAEIAILAKIIENGK